MNLKELRKLVDEGKLLRVNKRFSYNACVQDSGIKYDCRVSRDWFTTVSGKPKYETYSEVGNDADYRTIDIKELPKGKSLFYFHYSPKMNIGREVEKIELLEFIR